MIINLTPHATAIYPPDTPDRIRPGSVSPLQVFASCTDRAPARL